MTIAGIIVAAGRGTRAGGDLPKQWQDLDGRPVIAATLAALRPLVDLVLVVIHPEDRTLAERHLPGTRLVEGAETRAGSVLRGLEALAGAGVDEVLIHDAARPLADAALIGRLRAALDKAEAAAPGVAVSDALWTSDGGRVTGAQDRAGLWRAQTPQAFRYDAILAAHRAHPGGAADDVEVARAAGIEVVLVPGDEDNIKLTWPGDLARAGRLMRGRAMDVRMGNGFDVHAFGPGDHVWLCGVRLPHGQGLVGHSDADVGMHALTDAIYGALAEGDIGRHFPPSDPQWKGAASRIFLAHAAGRARARGLRLSHADVTLICERPKIGPHAEAMRAALAEILAVEVDRVSVKATTTERLGFAGREEGIAALATATLVSA